MVPGSTLMYGSSLRMETESPRALRIRPMLAAVIPLPSEEVTPPVTKTYFDMDTAPPGVFPMLPKTAPAGNADGHQGDSMFRLEPMDERTYGSWRARTVRLYAEEKVGAGNWPAEGAEERSEQE